MSGGYYGGNAFIIFLILILLVIGIGFWGGYGLSDSK
ncbi:MAG: sporulation protein YjcZ [Peptococcaceae bacterium]|nr:MAG: sporulation protein YjcZ [Peptococcaceae bacterium]